VRLPDGEFAWGLGDYSTNDKTVQNFKAFARRMYKSYCSDLADTNLFDQQMQDKVKMIQDRLIASGKLNLKVGHYGTLDLDTQVATTFKTLGPPKIQQGSIAFSVNGAGSQWNMGYPFDICELLDKRRVYHQPIGYDTTPVPMNKGVKTGEVELVNQLSRPRPEFGGRNCESIPYQGVVYSMGSIVWMRVLMRILYGDLPQFKRMYMGSSAFGPPMREAGHTFPGGIPVDGEGIVYPTAHDTPDVHWDFISDKGMVGSSGVDLYGKVGGQGVSKLTVADMRAIWDIVNTVNPLNLFKAILNLVATPTFSEFEGVFSAAWTAAQFFILNGLAPHTTYHIVQPRAGDSRTAWEHALWHAQDMATRLYLPFAS